MNDVRPEIDTDELPVADNAHDAVDDGPGDYPEDDGAEQDQGTEPAEHDGPDDADAEGEDDDPEGAAGAPDPERAGG